jgi:hypothetical protein
VNAGLSFAEILIIRESKKWVNEKVTENCKKVRDFKFQQ